MGYEIPPKLIAEINQGKCVLFVGAGLSIPAGLPTWVGLLKEMLAFGKDELNQIDDDTHDNIQELLDENVDVRAAAMVATHRCAMPDVPQAITDYANRSTLKHLIAQVDDTSDEAPDDAYKQHIIATLRAVQHPLAQQAIARWEASDSS